MGYDLVPAPPSGFAGRRSRSTRKTTPIISEYWQHKRRILAAGSPLDFLAEFTQHIPPKGSHLIRYYGWYSNKSRGMRKKAEADTSDEPLAEETATSRSSQAWAMLIKRVYEVDPLCCPECGGEMKVVSFIEPPQADVIEDILRGHQSGADQRFASVPVGGLWQSSTPRAPPDADGLVLELDAAYSDSSISSPGDDVALFVAGWLSTNTINGVPVGDINSQAAGDMNSDGLTNLNDAFILHNALLAATGSGLNFDLLTGAVSEPSSFMLWGIAIACCITPSA